ncbi:ATP-binding cassette domain-containing protein, partial [Actinotalea sp. C106]|uniref:ATP-binding cassette domain-containing protein n=1 Tax=Actinotalea sp. C106 TaxID=2908644 RepID=UPI0020279BF0
MTSTTTPAFAVEDLEVTLGRGSRAARVVRGVSWSVAPGQSLGVVGESGSGKSMTVLAATGLVPPPAQV